MEYRELLRMELAEEARSRVVWVLDRKTATVHCVNEMKFEDVAKLMQYSEEDYRRYYFWVVESEEEENAEALL